MAKFSLKLQSEVVEIENTDDSVDEFIVNEMGGDQQAEYMNYLQRTMTVVDGKPTGMKDFSEAYSSLLTRTLVGPDGKPVSVTTLKKWPGTALKGVFTIAQKLNGLNEDAVEEAKND